MRLTAEQGRIVVQLARSTLDYFVLRQEHAPKTVHDSFLTEKRGVFVTLNLSEGRKQSLRGCIGFTEPVNTLGTAVQKAAVLAASEDPRFAPVRREELDAIIVEVSVLTVPEELAVARRQEMPPKVKIGEDGLIISNRFTSGLLLPQVAVEQGWGPEEFLSQACMKAGMTPDSWLDKSTTVQTFHADVFAEQSPRGEVARVEL